MKCVKKKASNSALAGIKLIINNIYEYSIIEGHYQNNDYHILLHILPDMVIIDKVKYLGVAKQIDYKISVDCFEDNFIRLEDYREKQIENILVT